MASDWICDEEEKNTNELTQKKYNELAKKNDLNNIIIL